MGSLGRPRRLVYQVSHSTPIRLSASTVVVVIAITLKIPQLHLVFDEVQRRSAIRLLSIVRVTCDYTKALGLKKVGLFGTGFTMRASFYPEEFQRAGIALVRPKDSEREFIHGKYIGELLNNRFLPETRTEILNIAQRMRSEDGIEALVLAGTELPLLLRDTAAGIEFLDTTVIHVEAIVDELLR
jgi:aspartate racemase